jgi:hypothetical protein
MHDKPRASRTIRPAVPARSLLATGLLAGATVAAVAEPIEHPRLAVDLLLPAAAAIDRHGAAIRMALPPDRTPAERHRGTGTLRLTLADLGSAAPDPAALAAARPEPEPAVTAARRDLRPHPIGEAEAEARLAAARLADVETYTAAIMEIADSRRLDPAPIPMVDAASRAAMARIYGGEGAGAAERSGSDGEARLAALEIPAPAFGGAAPIDPVPARFTGLDPRPKRLAEPVAFTVAARLNGAELGPLPLLIRDDRNISIRLADLLPMLRPAIAPERLAALDGRLAGQTYATFNDLRAAGIAVRFDDRDRLLLAAR